MKRYWYKKDEYIRLDRNGFLLDPETYEGNYHNKVLRLEEKYDVNCLILLGGPGEGKTYAIEEEYKELEVPKEQKLFFDLGRNGTKHRIRKRIFNHSDVKKWMNSTYDLYLFMDSLDEGLLIYHELIYTLIDELDQLSHERLFLRLACRSNEWKKLYTDEFTELFEKTKMDILEIAPLTEKDANNIVIENSINGTDFEKELMRNNIKELTSKPMTLQMLIDIFLERGTLPSSLKNVYEKATLKLLTEANESHKNIPNENSNIDSNTQLLIAARIAAMTVLGNKSSIIVDERDDYQAENQELRIIDIAGGGFSDTQPDSIIDQNLVQKVLSSALFKSQGEGRVFWIHQNYASFLTSWFFEKENFSDKQITNIIYEQNTNMIFPQLKDLTSWISNIRESIFDYVLDSNPLILLESDLTTMKEKKKKKLTYKLLKDLYEEKIIEIPLGLERRFGKLYHDDLYEQLQPYFNSGNSNILSQKLAYQIATACNMSTYIEHALNVVFNIDEKNILREKAAELVIQLGSEEDKIRLKPLLTYGENWNDEYQQLKGLVLNELYPSLVGIEEVLLAIEIQGNENFFGIYRMFLWYLPELLNVKDLNECLEWASVQLSEGNEDEILREFMKNLILKGWEVYRREPENIKKNFIRFIVISDSQFNAINFLHKEIERDTKSKQGLIKDLISYMEFDNDDFKILSNKWIVHLEDMEWFIEQYKISNNEDRTKWAEIINLKLHYSPEKGMIIWELNKNDPILKEKTKNRFKASRLDDDLLQLRRASIADRRTDDEYFNNDALIEIEKYLSSVEEGYHQGWDNICQLVNKSVDVSDLSETEVYKLLEEGTKYRIFNAAKKYLNNTCIYDEYGGTAVFTVFRINAYIFLLKFDKETLQSIDQIEWEKLLPHLLMYSITIEKESKALLKQLVYFIYEKIPSKFVNSLQNLINTKNEFELTQPLGFIDNIEYCLDETINNSLVESFQKQDLNIVLVEEIFDILKYPGTKTIEESGINFIDGYFDPLSIKEETLDKIKAVTKKLVINCNNGTWERVWPHIKNNESFGIDVMKKIARESQGVLKFQEINELNLRNLFLWLEEKFPQENDRDRINGEAFFYSSRDFVEDLRKNTLNYLIKKGSENSLLSVREIVNAYPTIDMKFRFNQAIENFVFNKWKSLQPLELIKLAESQDSRFVLNEQHLIDVVLEALEKIEKRLHSKTPVMFALWNEINDGMHKPVTENQYSTYIKDRLEEFLINKGIIINREVEIRSPEDHLKGERTDIHIDAVKRYTSTNSDIDKISLIIEVKGNWNEDLFKAMEQQLAKRYLYRSGISAGIYLIGCFDSDYWAEENRRKVAKRKKRNKIRLKECLEKQSEELTDENLTIKPYIMDLSYLKE